MGKGGCGDCGMSCIKYLLFFFNILFWLAGLAILAIGIWVRVDDRFEDWLGVDTDQLNYLYTGAYILIGLGAFIALVGFLGCCGAIKESQCMLATFFVILLLLFCALLAAGIWAIVEKDTVKEKLDEYMDEEIAKVKKGEESVFMTAIQDAFKCCGKNGPLDYGVSQSGCDVTWTKGCSQEVWDWAKDNVYIIGGVAIGIAAIMLLGMIFSMCLCCYIRRGENEKY